MPNKIKESGKKSLKKSEIETLIEHVRNRECLFNLNDKNYHRKDIKDNNWNEISKLMNIDGESHS